VEDPFALDELRIRQPGKVLPERASYEIFDTRRNLLAVARETERRSLIEALACGQLRKTWAGVRKELFTEADNYTLTFTAQVPAHVRRLIVMLPIVLDLSAHGPY
jgi:Scramblase